jgi:transcription elongation factor GreA
MSTEATYLTREKAEELRKELEYKKGPARLELAARLRAAIQQGDLSENADYSSAKEDQAFLEGRIADLERILANVIFIEDAPRDPNRVSIGSTVVVQEGAEEPEEFQVVGPNDADPVKGKISYESPIGKALIDRKLGEVASAETPGGVIKFKILKIK